MILRSLMEFAGRDPNAFGAARAYPDEDFELLVGELAAASATPREDFLRGFGRFAATTAFRRLYPSYYEDAGDARTFLLGVEDRIHELVRATVPSASPPRLGVVPLGDDSVVVTYTSERRLCAMLEGLVEGVAEHYGQSFRITQRECMLRGDPGCVVVVEPA